MRRMAATIVPVVLLSGVIAAQAANGTAWTIEKTPNPSVQSYLESVSCASARACIAVGNTGTGKSLAERYNGHRWALQHARSRGIRSFLGGISCWKVNACIAVGASATRSSSAERWGVLVERWDGHNWTIRTAPNASGSGSYLDSVSCASATACTAVGYTGSGRALAESWDGRKWKLHSTGRAGLLSWVSCASKNACMAVGATASTATLAERPMAERWNGHKWTAQALPGTGANSTLSGVSCPSDRACMAVGFKVGQPTAERWSAGKWTLLPSLGLPLAPRAVTSGFLNGVSCRSATSCTTVGTHLTGPTTQVTLVANWDGHRWTRPRSPNPAAPQAYLNADSCISSKTCMAIGGDGNGKDGNAKIVRSLAERN